MNAKLSKAMTEWGSLRDWAPALGMSHETLRRKLKNKDPKLREELQKRVLGIIAMIATTLGKYIVAVRRVEK